MKTHTATFVEASDIIPEEWKHWFWDFYSECSEFCWGTNNRSLVTASAFLSEIHEHMAVDEPDYESGETDDHDVMFTQCDLYSVQYSVYKTFIETLEKLGETYIDLEN